MPHDLTGGLDPATDGVLVDQPDDPTVGENHAFWLFDDAGRYSLLCAHVQVPGPPVTAADTRRHGEAPSDWALRRLAYAFTLPDGRVLTDWQVGSGSSANTVAVGDCSFRQVEPFVRWRADMFGEPRVVTGDEMLSRPVGDGHTVDFALTADMIMARPPWVQGSLAPDSPERTAAMAFVGGDRYEQLFRAEVSVTSDGEQHQFAASGLRTHRVGARTTGGMLGHSWCTAVFPSGRAFAYMAWPRPDWTVSFAEGFVDDGDHRAPLSAAEFPWLTSLEYAGEKFQIVLHTEGGRHEIEGETLASSAGLGRGFAPGPQAWAIVHGMARFRWDGEEATGLIERSAPGDRLTGQA